MMTEDLTINVKMAEAYEKNTRISVPTYDSLFVMVQSYFRMQLGSKSASLLVIGAGGGSELAAWGPSNPGWTFTGVDPSEEMLKIAKYKSAKLGLEDRVSFVQGTIDDLPESDSKFDAASCILVLHFIDDVQEKLKLLRSIKDKVKSGAPFVLVSAYGNLDDSEFQARLDVWKSFWIAGGREPSEVDDMINNNFKKLSLLPEQEIEGLLADSGFTRIARFYSTGIMAGWICHAK